jgi:hypothetical protein
VPGDGEVVLLHGEGVGALTGGEVGGGHGGVATGAGEVLDAQRLVGPLVVRIHAEGGRARARAHQQVRSPAQQQYGAAGGRTREVADVGGAGHQRGSAAAGRTSLPEPFAAGRIHL